MSRTFATRSGRIVRELDGIEPDSTIADTVFPAPVQYLLSNSVFFRFGSWLTGSWDALPPAFSADMTTVNTFLQFVASQPASRRSAMLASLATTKDVAVKAGASAATLKHLESAEAMANRELDRSLRMHEPLLRELLEQEILSRFSDERIRIARSLRFDPVLTAAASILGTTRYSTFLAPTSKNEH
jgi:carboxyl-terminal processing protease